MERRSPTRITPPLLPLGSVKEVPPHREGAPVVSNVTRISQAPPPLPGSSVKEAQRGEDTPAVIKDLSTIQTHLP